MKDMGMSFLNDTDHVKEQYQKPDGLSTRISIHEKYSTNKMGLSNWYFTVYKIEKGMKILELGCGRPHEGRSADIAERIGHLYCNKMITDAKPDAIRLKGRAFIIN